MRSFLLSILIACSSIALQAQSVHGIRVDAGGQLVLVYLNGQQISQPASSCFIANLTNGRYAIEVYDASAYRFNKRHSRGKLLYRESVRYMGRGIKDIQVCGSEHGVFPDVLGNRHPYPEEHFRGIMSPETFDAFYQVLADKKFLGQQIEMLENAIVTARFSSSQCARILSVCHFDSERMKLLKLLYPAVADKQNFFMALEKLDFDSSKKTMNRFMKEYYSKHN